MVKGDEPFGNSHIGITADAAHLLPYSEYAYPPVPESASTVVPLKEHRSNICDVLVGDSLNMREPTYGDPAIIIQVTLLAVFVVTRILSSKWVTKSCGVSTVDLRDKRNFVVYWIELIFSSVALPLAIITLVEIYRNTSHYNAVDPDVYDLARGLINTQTFLYLMELFYRVQIRSSLLVHHLMTSGTVIFLNMVLYSTYSRMALEYGLTLILLAMTEQPLYIILLLRLLGFRERRPHIWPQSCRAASAIFLASRLIIVILLINLMVQYSTPGSIGWQIRDESFSDWWDHSNDWWVSTLR